MKKCLQFLSLILFFAVFTTSCRSENEEDKIAVEQPNYLNGFIQKDNGAKIKMNLAIVNGGKYANPGQTNTYVFNFGAQEGTEIRTAGFTLEFPSTTNINGTYTSTGGVKTFDVDSFVYSDSFNQNQTDPVATSATCTLSRNSPTNFTMTFKVTLNTGVVIKGEFSDEIAIVESNL